MITVLMVLDAVVGLLLIASVIMQTPKSAGMGMGGGSDTVFSSSTINKRIAPRMLYHIISFIY